MSLPFNYRQCPYCGGLHTTYLYGVLENKRRCCDCQHIYYPHEEHERHLAAERERLAHNTHRE